MYAARLRLQYDDGDGPKCWKLKRQGGEYLYVNEFTVPRHKRWPVYKSDNAKRQPMTPLFMDYYGNMHSGRESNRGEQDGRALVA